MKNTLIALALTACASTAFAQSPVFVWDYTANGWSASPPGAMTVANGEMTLSRACGRYDTNNPWATFAYASHPLTNSGPLANMVMSLTRLNTDLRIDIRVLDTTNNNALLFEHTAIDTPQADPVSPIGSADLPGTPAPMISGTK